MARSTRYLLPLLDYQRIFQVAHGIIREVGHDVSKSCLFFSTVGAFLLSRNYGVTARPVVGGAFYKIDTSDKVLAVADAAYDFERSSADGFHCWVEAGDWYIDFTAPLFPEMAAHSGHKTDCSRKMFQKHRRMMAESFDALVVPGDFFLEPNAALTQDILGRDLQRNDVTDLLNIAALWFQKPPRSTQQSVVIRDDLGNVKNLRLAAPLISGAW
ncbi:hypothetical protein bAD24_p00710 (plasmid) [Burkholderia sp. AD24]|nr:hypothetical protein bAD24_p00710 [Burkholderia sp. AD24]